MENELPDKFPKTEKIEVRLRQDLADRLPRGKTEKNEFINRAVEHELNNTDRLRQMGRMSTPAKSASSRENGKLGGRPKGSGKKTPPES